MVRRDPLRVIEAAYSLTDNEQVWMRGVLDALEPYELGHGAIGYIADLGSKVAMRAFTSSSAEGNIVRESPGAMSGTLFRKLHAPRQVGWNGDLLTGDLNEMALQVRQYVKNLEGRFGGRVPLAHCVVGGDTRETVVLGLCSPVRELAPGTRVALDAFGAHAGSALRLRRLLQRTREAPADAADAVLSPTGKVVGARTDTARGSLTRIVDAARRTERARSRRTSAEERLALWTALFDGRWSIVDYADTDGKRLLLACKNPPRTARMRELSERERSVTQYAALGHSIKYIAYELGISSASVSATLRGALLKLGFRSRADLIRLLGAKYAA